MLQSIRSILLHASCCCAVAYGVNALNAQSNVFCSTLDDLGKRSFEKSETLSVAELFPDNNLGTSEAGVQSDCKTSLSSQYVLTCTWQFPYRSELATERFNTARELIASCANDPSAFTKDQNVNHPDYYEAYYYDAGNNALSASIKDKGALQQTLVFLRMK